MIKRFILKNSERFLSRWIVLAFDVGVVFFAYQSAVLLRYNLEINTVPQGMFLDKLPLVLCAYGVGMLLSQSYVGVVRHTSLTDAYSIFRASLIGVAILFTGSIISYWQPAVSRFLLVPNSIILIHFFLAVFLLIGSRLMVKVLYRRIQSDSSVKKRVVVYGAGASGRITKNTLVQDTANDFEVIAFIDDNSSKIGKKIEGIPIFHRDRVLSKDFIKKNKVSQIIISIQESLSNQRRSEIVELCLSLNLKVKIVPPVEKWIQGELSTKQIKAVRIEDLLEREPIVLDSANVERELRTKTILVTGAAGSIGSEIARQVMHYRPARVILLDQAESAIYGLEHELQSEYPQLAAKAECIIADVRDRKRMAHIFEYRKPDIVFHAAAYKHVPLMEDNPYEAVGVNVLGTQVMADLSVEYQVQKFVMVSTDKAVNPTNVMGATKRSAELYTQNLGARPGCKTQFITTRFGNVLGSNGSVIPIFRKQIQKGGPITITHREITRYFMTIPEACNLVLEAGAMGKGGEIFVFDMGQSVKIYDLAKKMIKLSGLRLGKDIEIQEIGLRPGEKLYEELLANQENTQATHHPKIMIAKTNGAEHINVLQAFKAIAESHAACNNLSLVRSLKELVPEFISNNSVYAQLDLKNQVG